MILAIDGAARIIDLDDSTSESIPEIYSSFTEQHKQNLDWLPAFQTLAQLPLVPVYLTLINGWKFRQKSTGQAYIKSYKNGFINTDDSSDPFIENGGVEPRVRFEQPVLAVGYNSGVSGQQVWSSQIGGDITAEQLINIIAAAVAGKSSRVGSHFVFRNAQDTKNMITAQTDGDGSRLTVEYDL